MVGEYIRALVIWIAFIAVPVLLVLSLRGWLRYQRIGWGTWRDRLALASIATVSIYWLMLPVWIFAVKLTGTVRAQLLGDVWLNTTLIAMILAAALSSFLKGSARVEAFTASIMMMVVFYLSAVE